MIVVWEKLLPLLNEEVELDKDEAELIFSEFKNLYSEDELKITGEHIEYSVAMYGIEEGMKSDHKVENQVGWEDEQQKE